MSIVTGTRSSLVTRPPCTNSLAIADQRCSSSHQPFSICATIVGLKKNCGSARPSFMPSM